MRIIYLTGDAEISEDLGPIVIGGGGGATLPPGTEGQVLGYGPGGVPVAVDVEAAAYDDTAITQRIDGIEASIPAPYDDAELRGIANAAQADADTALSQIAALPPAYDDTALSGRVTALEDAPAVNWDGLNGKPSTFPPAAHSHPWGDITGRPSTFTPSAHGHAIADVSGLQGALDGKAATAHTHAWADVTGKPATYPPSTHGHAIADVAGLQAALDAAPKAGYRIIAATGNYVTQAEPMQTLITQSMLSNRLRMAAFAFDRNITITEAGISISTAAAGLARFYVYERTGTDQMTLIKSSGDLNTGSNGYVGEPWSFTFQAGVVYFAGAVFSATPTVRSVGANQSILSVGSTSPTQTTQTGAFQTVVTFGDTPASPIGIVSTAVNSPAAALYMRMA